MTEIVTHTYRGKSVQFVSEISKSLICPIHSGLFKQPVIASCGHSFCQSCILGVFDSHNEPQCPIDHASLKEQGFLIPNLAVESQINELLVYCKYSLKTGDQPSQKVIDPEGCKRKLILADKETHEESCEFAIVSCPNCKVDLRRKDLQTHSANCSQSPCPHATSGCDFFGELNQIEGHLKTCQYEKIKGFLSKHNDDMKELKQILIQKEHQFNATQEVLTTLQKQLEQVLSVMETNNNRVEGALRYVTNSVDELKLQVSKNCTDIGEMQAGKGRTIRSASVDKREIGPPVRNNQLGGHVPGVPGLNVTCHGSLTGHTGPVWALGAFEGYIISGSSDSTVKIWELATSSCKATLTGHEGIVHAVAVNNRHVISGSSDKLIKVWDIETCKCIRTLAQHDNTVCSLVVGGGYIFSGSFTEIKVWNPHTYEQEGALQGHNHWVRAIAIQDRTLYSGSHNIIKVWSLDNFQCTGTITAQCGSIYSLAVYANWVLAGTFENLIYVWDRETFRCIATLHGHFGAVYNLCVSGDRLFSASYDTSIRVWSLETLRCLQTIGHHSSSVEALLLWGGFLFSGSADATIKVWR